MIIMTYIIKRQKILRLINYSQNWLQNFYSLHDNLNDIQNFYH